MPTFFLRARPKYKRSRRLVSSFALPVDLELDLTASWRMEEATGNRLDSSGNSRTLTDSGTVSNAAGLLGNAAEFDGTNYLYRSGDAALDFDADPFSISLWFNTPDVSAVGYLLSKYYFLGGTGYYLEITSDTLVFWTGSGLSCSIAGLEDQWNHVVVTIDGSGNAKLYLNNVLVDSDTITPVASSAADLTIGTAIFDGSPTGPYTGLIDATHIYSRVINSGEVSALFNGGAGYEVVVASPIQGNISQTLPFLNQSISGKSIVTGTASQTLHFLNQSISGKSIVSGTASQTLPFLNQSLSGKSIVQGSISQTLVFLDQSISAKSIVQGSASQTLVFLNQSISAKSLVQGSVSQTLPFLNQSLSAKSLVSGSISQTLPFISQSLSGGNVAVGNIDQTLAFLSQSLSGKSIVNGTCSVTLTFLNQSLSGKSLVIGTCSVTLPFLSQSLSGKSVVNGSASQTLPFITQTVSAKSLVQADISQTLTFLNQSLDGEVFLQTFKPIWAANSNSQIVW